MKTASRQSKSSRLAVAIGASLAAVTLLGPGAVHTSLAATAVAPATTKSRGVHASPSRAVLDGVAYVSQTWNNCGPASTAEVLAYWGIYRTQEQAAAYLRSDGGQGMQPYGWPSYARSLGLHALLGVGGSPKMVKALIANGFPVIVNQVVSPTDSTRHYRPIVSYDDARQTFTAMDPYMGPNYAISYADFSKIWAPLHRRFTILYPPAKASLLKAVLHSAGWDCVAAVKADMARLKKRMAHPRTAEPMGMPNGGATSAYKGQSLYLNLAWDDEQLGLTTAATTAIAKAVARNASPVLAAWVRGELNVAQDV